MTFLRTPAGIENRGLFFDNSITVYIEMDSAIDPARAVDMAFWREFFTFYYPGMKVTFSPLGGKMHVLNACLRIIKEDVKNAICVMDADYDRECGTSIEDPRVFYTYGYGVENDVLSSLSMLRVLKTLTPGMPHIEQRSDDLVSFIQQTADLDWYLFKSDQLGTPHGCATLNRENPSSDIVHDTKALPVRLRREAIREKIKELRIKRQNNLRCNSRGSKVSSIPSHHYFDICYHTVCRFIAAVSRVKVSKNHFMSVCIGSIDGVFSRYNGPIRRHFDEMAGRDIQFKL